MMANMGRPLMRRAGGGSIDTLKIAMRKLNEYRSNRSSLSICRRLVLLVLG